MMLKFKVLISTFLMFMQITSMVRPAPVVHGR